MRISKEILNDVSIIFYGNLMGFIIVLGFAFLKSNYWSDITYKYDQLFRSETVICYNSQYVMEPAQFSYDTIENDAYKRCRLLVTDDSLGKRHYFGYLLTQRDTFRKETFQSTEQQPEEKTKDTANEPYSFSNAFLVTYKGYQSVCSAEHCLKTLNATQRVGDDAMLWQSSEAVGFMKKNQAISFKAGFLNSDTQTVFVEGYRFIGEKLVHVSYSGIGRKMYYPTTKDSALYLKLPKKHNFAGLSGAPAVNYKGEVIGVHSATYHFQSGADTVYYAKIALFKKDIF